MKVLLITLLVIATTLVLGQPQNYRDSRYANLQLYYPYPTEIPPGVACCNLPQCSDYGCFRTKVCGYLCQQGDYKGEDYGPTPGYRLKSTYKENTCLFGECNTFDIDCSSCPDPKNAEFRIYAVKKSCAKCYER
ncbi:unnamed protein product [Brassicogethes aeneus]|uniref:Uncharacterized protein n=1 Tax=Brassicogethes aeneus TaxID=1431903 RepID=A0A9P0FA70_BRAAE|nr:unnamed protein product [Brassicogethes aeneus]